MQRPVIIRGVILASVASAAFAGQAWAQNRDKAWEVVPEVGYVSYGEPNLGNGTSIGILPPPTSTRDVRVVTSTIKNSPSYAFRFGYHFSKKHMIEFGFSGASTTGTFQMHKTVYDTSVTPNTVKSNVTKNESVSIDLFMAHANYIYNFFLQHRGKVVGFVTGGGGILNSSMFGQTADPDMQPIIDFLVGDENDFMYDYGAGIRFFGSEKVGFRIDARQVHYSSSTRGSQVQTEATVGLTLILGGA